MIPLSNTEGSAVCRICLEIGLALVADVRGKNKGLPRSSYPEYGPEETQKVSPKERGRTLHS